MKKNTIVICITLILQGWPAFSQFTEVITGLPGLYGASAEFGDFDGDGDLDILMGGVNRGIFRNDNGSFVNINADLEDYPYDVAWGDYDNDGDIDVLMNGAVYQNNGGAFSLINTPVQDANEAKMQWIDYDGDGDLDISQIA
ncbi:MAG TPA: VCBS repeat-containing protein, partial [bacterium]|nr:VCBS repeat-containing protein [bacterium]